MGLAFITLSCLARYHIACETRHIEAKGCDFHILQYMEKKLYIYIIENRGIIGEPWSQ